jgi:hypothetical protein
MDAAQLISAHLRKCYPFLWVSFQELHGEIHSWARGQRSKKPGMYCTLVDSNYHSVALTKRLNPEKHLKH